jgi:hypothetical protein
MENTDIDKQIKEYLAQSNQVQNVWGRTSDSRDSWMPGKSLRNYAISYIFQHLMFQWGLA